MHPPLLLVSGVERRLPAQLAHLPVDVLTAQPVAALETVRAQLRLGLGRRHLCHRRGVHDLGPRAGFAAARLAVAALAAVVRGLLGRGDGGVHQGEVVVGFAGGLLEGGWRGAWCELALVCLSWKVVRVMMSLNGYDIGGNDVAGLVEDLLLFFLSPKSSCCCWHYEALIIHHLCKGRRFKVTK